MKTILKVSPSGLFEDANGVTGRVVPHVFMIWSF